MTSRPPATRTTLSCGPIETKYPTDAPLNAVILPLLLLFALAAAGCGHRSYSNHVELVTNTENPTPGMTFELRFEAIMVKGDQVGLPAANSPLLISPDLAGTFTWLSPRSGVFTPSESLAIDKQYALSLRSGLRSADGSPYPASLHWIIQTPAFGVIDSWPQRTDTNAGSDPEIKLAFNADVRAVDAAPYVYFSNLAGHRVPADVRQGTFGELWSNYEYGTLRTWRQEAAAMNQPAGEDRTNAIPANPTNEVSNLLVAEPRKPLPVGKGWKLVVAGGLPAADGTLHSREKSEVTVGDVTPFVIQEVAAENYINSGSSVRVRFSKPVPESLTNRFRDWIDLNHAPTNLTAEVHGRTLAFSGNFKGGSSLTLKVRPGFGAIEPFTLQGSNTFELTMPHVAPRLYFPALSRDQLAGGNRTFPLLTINVRHVRVRAKLMNPAAAIHALRAYGSYFASWDQRRHDWDEPYRAIDYNVLPGVTVFDQEIDQGTAARDSDESQTRNLSWDELLGGRQAGVVFLDARDVDDDRAPALGTQTLIQLTDLGLTWKKSSSGVDVLAFSHTTGQPVTGAAARLMNNENQVLREAVTGSNGLAHLAPDTNAAWVAVQSGDDFHAVLLDRNRIWQYRFESRMAGSEQPEDPRRIMVFSDRDLYRPGESMHLEAIVRNWAGQGLSIPAGLKGTLKCIDAREKMFFQTNAEFSALGSWSTLVPLPIGSRGFYSARLNFGTNEPDYTYQFQVRDFQPNAFEITLPFQPVYAAGEAIQLPLSARYLFGKALSRALVKWSLEATDTDFRPEKFQNFSFRRSDFESRYGRGQSSVSLNGRGVLTSAGNYVIGPAIAPNPVAPQPRAVSLLAEVTDVNQQTLSHRVEFMRHSSDFYLGLRQGAEVIDSNTAPPLEVVALRTDGKPWPDTVKSHFTLARIDWQTIRIQGAGKTVHYRNEQIFTNLLEMDLPVEPITSPAPGDDEARGNRIAGLPPLPAGDYLAEIKAEDAGQRPVIASLNFQVTAPAETGWNYRNDVDLALKPDRKEYLPGDTAVILVEAPFSGTALVTVEREKVLRSFVTRLEGNAPSFRIPIEPGDVPNVFVSVTLLRGSDESPHKAREPEYRFGSCELPVSNPQNRLAIQIAPASTNILPGQPVDITVQLTDAAHQPVAGAEVILYAVDDGILGMTGYELPDPHAFFYAPRPLGVLSSMSLPNLLPEDPDELRFENKGYLGGGGGRERVRKNFLACAFWNAALQSDANGRVHARFIAPDSLTRYRLFAVAHTADSRFGSGQSAFHVTKPLVIEPALPSIANVTDHLVARGVVLNQTTNSGEIIVSLSLDGKAKTVEPEPDLARHVTVPANGSAVVEFPVVFTDTGESKWLWQAHFADPVAGDFTDAVQSTIPVGHIAPLMGEVLLSRVTAAQTNLLALANPQLLAGRGTITINVANTRLNELGGSIAQLLHYPYGCAEQTGSSLLPWIVLRDAHGLLQHYLGSKTNDADAAIRAGVARLFSMQTQSGGLGYWPRDREPMLWASAYGGMVLALAQRHGVSVPKDDFASLLAYLSEQLRLTGDATDDLSDQCLALYALALTGKAEPAYHEQLYAQRGKLSVEDRALLALAIAASHGPSDMVGDLLRSSPPPRTAAGRFGCPAREQAIRLLAWIYYRPEDSMVDRLVGDLMHEQKQANWETTQGNAWALLALTEYARRVETGQPPAAGELHYGGQSAPFHLDAGTNIFAQTFIITNSIDAKLSLLNASTNCLYITTSIEARPQELPQPRQDRGISLQRRYDRLNDDNEPQDIAGLRVGDRVLVTLRLNLRDSASYVVIDDALPATLEAVNAAFRTQQARPSDLAGNEIWWAGDFQEIRKDRCLSFANWLEPGTYVLRYVARVRAAGSVTAPPAKAEEMYHPERCGFTESQTLVSESLN